MPLDRGNIAFSILGKRIAVRWMASSLEEFRRATSKVATFAILASIPLFTISSFLPHQQSMRGIPALYLILALILKITIRRSAVDSLTAVQVIETVLFATVLVTSIGIAYRAWIDGVEGLVDLIINGSMLAAAAWVARKNIASAKITALQAQALSGSQDPSL
jgi:hypothetical protein